jgi:hypothetical protein
MEKNLGKVAFKHMNEWFEGLIEKEEYVGVLAFVFKYRKCSSWLRKSSKIVS